MTEIAIELSELMKQQPSPNGHVTPEPEAKGEAAQPAAARVDATRGVFITSRGDEIEMSGKKITALLLDRVANQGKPDIPRVEVTLLGKHKQLEANPHDEGYRALLAEWEERSRIRVLKYIYTLGVKNQPPLDFVEEQRAFFPDADALEMKYLYIASLIPDDDIEAFTEAVMGKSVPTAKGMEEVANFTE